MYKFAALLVLACVVAAAPKPGYSNGYSGYDTYNGNIGYAAVPVATSYSNRYDGNGYGLNGYGTNGYYGNGYGSVFGHGGYGSQRGNIIGYGTGNGYYSAGGYGAGNGYNGVGYGTGYNRW